jgi:hypothetical protein
VLAEIRQSSDLAALAHPSILTHGQRPGHLAAVEPCPQAGTGVEEALATAISRQRIERRSSIRDGQVGSTGLGPGHPCGRILVGVDEPERGWRPGEHILVDLPDGQSMRCRIVNINDDGTIRVVPEHAVVVQ